MPKRKQNPYLPALRNLVGIWSGEQLIRAIDKIDREFSSQFAMTRRLMDELLAEPPPPRVPPGAPPGGPHYDFPSLTEVAEGLLGACEKCGKPKAMIIADDGKGKPVAVCGDCYAQLPVPTEPAEGKADE